MNRFHFNNYAPQSVSDKGKNQIKWLCPECKTYNKGRLEALEEELDFLTVTFGEIFDETQEDECIIYERKKILKGEIEKLKQEKKE